MGIREKILWWAAKRRIAKDKPKIIAIGGAIAKTSTKTALGELLNQQFPTQVRVGYGNLNSLLGVPLSIFGFELDFYKQKIGYFAWFKILLRAILRSFFKKLPKILVLEYGTDQPGDIEAITEQLPPDIGVITIVGPAHLANYPSMREVVKDEGYIAERTKQNGIVFVNSSDEFLTDYYRRAKARVVNVITPLELIAQKFTEAIAIELGVERELIKEYIKNIKRPEHRLNIIELGDVTLIDDTYNSSPLAVKAALHVLKKFPGRKVAILGSMKELGSDSEKYHQQIGQYAQKYCDEIVAVGLEAKHFGARRCYSSSAEASAKVVEFIEKGDTVLVKGSKSVNMQVIVDRIKNKFGGENVDI
ncbi:hypothetical protein HY844_03000 [Candidatus Berkelbacteria bacterium]|nr:hypothetical protein [Candidatus Berkelbacteria bacterium]